MHFNISCIGFLALFPNDFLVQALSLTATNATQFANGTLLAQEILPTPPVSTLAPSSVCQVDLDSIFSLKKITENPTDTVVQFVQTYCEPRAQFLSSKTSNLYNFSRIGAALLLSLCRHQYSPTHCQRSLFSNSWILCRTKS